MDFLYKGENTVVCRPRHIEIFVECFCTSFALSRNTKREENYFERKTCVTYLTALRQIVFAVLIAY
jgi:hypothetical protein